jgi:hypothetical protein
MLRECRIKRWPYIVPRFNQIRGPNGAGSALGTTAHKNPLTRPIRVESMSHEDADAENDSRCRNDLGHSLPPCPEMPGRAARMNWR